MRITPALATTITLLCRQPCPQAQNDQNTDSRQSLAPFHALLANWWTFNSASFSRCSPKAFHHNLVLETTQPHPRSHSRVSGRPRGGVHHHQATQTLPIDAICNSQEVPSSRSHLTSRQIPIYCTTDDLPCTSIHCLTLPTTTLQCESRHVPCAPTHGLTNK